MGRVFNVYCPVYRTRPIFWYSNLNSHSSFSMFASMNTRIPSTKTMGSRRNQSLEIKSPLFFEQNFLFHSAPECFRYPCSINIEFGRFVLPPDQGSSPVCFSQPASKTQFGDRLYEHRGLLLYSTDNWVEVWSHVLMEAIFRAQSWPSPLGETSGNIYGCWIAQANTSRGTQGCNDPTASKIQH